MTHLDISTTLKTLKAIFSFQAISPPILALVRGLHHFDVVKFGLEDLQKDEEMSNSCNQIRNFLAGTKKSFAAESNKLCRYCFKYLSDKSKCSNYLFSSNLQSFHTQNGSEYYK